MARRGPAGPLPRQPESPHDTTLRRIRIIDITHVLAGPFAAYQLAVLGADVIKVEHPDDRTRAAAAAPI
jgi:crotonobetainyl-CoA:carnitine CoA-transferase CaiB-like acyl-CoA transferase